MKPTTLEMALHFSKIRGASSPKGCVMLKTEEKPFDFCCDEFGFESEFLEIEGREENIWMPILPKSWHPYDDSEDFLIQWSSLGCSPNVLHSRNIDYVWFNVEGLTECEIVRIDLEKGILEIEDKKSKEKMFLDFLSKDENLLRQFCWGRKHYKKIIPFGAWY